MKHSLLFKSHFLKISLVFFSFFLLFIQTTYASHTGNRYKWDGESIKEQKLGKVVATFRFLGEGCSVKYSGTLASCPKGTKPDMFYTYLRTSGDHYYIRIAKAGSSTGAKYRIDAKNKVVNSHAIDIANASNETKEDETTKDDEAEADIGSKGDDSVGNTNDNTAQTNNNGSSVTNNSGTVNTAATTAPKEYKSVLFPKVCDNSKSPLKCWSGQIFNYASVVVGSLAVVAIMVGGVLYIVSGGNPERIGLGKKIMFNALMGVATIVLANWFFRSVLGIGNWGL